MSPEAGEAADLAACYALLGAGSRSFALVSRLLPERVRAPAAVLYAFCRCADDAVDTHPGASEETIALLRGRLDAIYRGTPADEPVDRALARVVTRLCLPRAAFDALLEGLAWDAAGRRYETLDELYGYAARVAGSVGVMMTAAMGGARDEATLARACDLGVAMQLTNIARDIGEDAARGRVYLPLSWMRARGLEPEAFVRRPRHDAVLADLVARLLAAADALYVRADGGIARLPADCRTAIFAARLVYAEIGRAIARARYDAVTRRAVVSFWRKLVLVVSAFRARLLRREEDAAPPLEPVRFLVSACKQS